MKNLSKPLTTRWPSYINPKNGENLRKIKESNRKLYLKSKTGEFYPILKGIPRIIQNFNNYSDAFGDQWKRWRKTQLDSYSGTNISRNRIYRCLGKSILNHLKNYKKQINVLEVGCGAGRFTEILLNFPIIKLTSIDFSNAVEANNLNFSQNRNHRIIQADIMECPFKPMQYDIVICLGVIQHTPNPEITIQKLYEQVKPGGSLIIDHYTWDISRVTKITANFLRPFIKRLSSKKRINTIKYLVNIFFPLHKLFKKMPICNKFLSRISPILTYFHAYPELSDNLQKEWSMLDTHDFLTDWYKHLRTSKQIKKYLKKNNSVSIKVCISGNNVEARCKRPLNKKN